jgi:phytanoyl-CoA hydroxylase
MNEQTPQMIFRVFDQETRAEEQEMVKVYWEGGMPDGAWPPPCDGLFEAGFIPVECKAGDLVCFPGELDHLSLANYSEMQRHTFQLHLVDGPGACVEWSPENWLQYPAGHKFPAVRRDSIIETPPESKI